MAKQIVELRQALEHQEINDNTKIIQPILSKNFKENENLSGIDNNVLAVCKFYLIA